MANRTRLLLLFLLTVIILPLIFMVTVEPTYTKLAAWEFLLIFVVVLPAIATLLSQVISNRAVGFHPNTRTLVKQISYRSLAYYLILCTLAGLALFLLMFFGII